MNNNEFITGVDLYKKVGLNPEKFNIVRLNSDGDEEIILADYSLYSAKEASNFLAIPKDSD